MNDFLIFIMQIEYEIGAFTNNYKHEANIRDRLKQLIANIIKNKSNTNHLKIHSLRHQ